MYNIREKTKDKKAQHQKEKKNKEQVYHLIWINYTAKKGNNNNHYYYK